jgi:hypothetical protein
MCSEHDKPDYEFPSKGMIRLRKPDESRRLLSCQELKVLHSPTNVVRFVSV